MVKLGRIVREALSGAKGMGITMSPFMNKLNMQIFKDRIKPFLIIYLILFIAYLIISTYALKDKSVNFFYNGIGQLIIAGFWLLMGIEHFLLKKKLYSIISLTLTLMAIYLAMQSFNLFNLK